MNTSQVISKCKVLFTHFEPINETLYKGLYTINDKLAGIYFLNFSNRIIEEDFEELQYKYLAEEFYKNEDSLQWNIYLLFINSEISNELKTKILTNHKYARKLIFHEDEFINYFELEKSNQTLLPDLVSKWKKELEEVDLQEVYSESPYVDVVANFLKNTTIKEIPEIMSRSLISTPIINKINNINLKETYRAFPLIRNFDFASVNLIYGANGSGKTSLLESIELILTGRTSRNSDINEKTGSINAILNNEIEDIYTPHDLGKYKTRDIKWYNRNHLTRGNNCYQSFNQFNFFNTDASYHFAYSDQEDQINESLKQIILGAEYTFLRDRIIGIENRLRPELNGIERHLNERNELIKKNTQLLNDLKLDKNKKDIINNIASNIEALNYKNTISEDKYSISNLYINEIKIETEYIINQNFVFDFFNLNKLRISIDEQLDIINISKEKYENKISKHADLLKELRDLEYKRNKINTILKYFLIDDLSNIENIEEKLQNIIVKLSKLNRIKDALPLLNLDPFLDENIELLDLQKTKEFDLQKIRFEIKEIEVEIKIINRNFSAIEDLINKIKLLGKDYLLQNNHSQNCPLCEQKISHIELYTKLDENFKNTLDKSILENKNKKLTELKEIEKNLISEYDTLKGWRFISKEEDLNFETLIVKEIKARLNSILSNEEVFLNEKIKIEKTLSQLKAIGGSISEYISLKEEIKGYLKTDDLFEIKQIHILLFSLEEEIQTLKNSIDILKHDIDVLIFELNKSLRLKKHSNDIAKILEEIKSQAEKIKALEKSFIKIKTHLNLHENQSVLELKKGLYILQENIKLLMDTEIQQKEFNRVTKELEDAKSYIDINTIKYNRLNKALKVLVRQKLNSGESVLADYFKENLKEIKDIFKTIHAPQEFSDIKFESKSLVLYKNDVKHSVSQISTGQRAALVISIFISLNRKLKNGPNIIIFDDPVTFIDDFNALSFLDFLRYFVVKEKKQIFFSTANKKFSTLFKKKFDFLGGSFKEIELIR